MAAYGPDTHPSGTFMRGLWPGALPGVEGAALIAFFHGNSVPLQQRGAGNSDTNVRIPVLPPVTTDLVVLVTFR